jgi:hypothetical protein
MEMGRGRKFIAKSVYHQLTEDDSGQAFQVIWKAKIPLWMVAQRAILTKDNILAMNW